MVVTLDQAQVIVQLLQPITRRPQPMGALSLVIESWVNPTKEYLDLVEEDGNILLKKHNLEYRDTGDSHELVWASSIEVPTHIVEGAIASYKEEWLKVIETPRPLGITRVPEVKLSNSGVLLTISEYLELTEHKLII